MRSRTVKLLAMFLLVLGLVPLTSFPVAHSAPNFANDKFKQLWEYSDKLVDEVPGAGRGFTWGPNSFGVFQEDYQEAPGGKRQVQYFDKSRMELSPDGTYVTNGLLTKELVTGQRQEGNEKNVPATPSTVQIAGDDNSAGGNGVAPTYASFKQLVTFSPGQNTAPDRTGQTANLAINKAGTVSTLDNPPAQVQIGYYESTLGHNVPAVFQAFQNLVGRTWNGSAYTEGKIYTDNPIANVFGFPISEAYWVRAVVGGQEKDVLVQLYERRVLTYTPTNNDPFKVEMGNIGQHYYQWRYATPTPPTYEVNGQWYGITAQGKTLQFTVANNIITSITVNFGPTSCTATFRRSFTDLQVKGEGFAVAADNLAFSGTFSSANRVSGKFSVQNYISSCATSADTTWVAARVGTPLPPGKFDGYWDGNGSGVTVSLTVSNDVITGYYLEVTCGSNSSSVENAFDKTPIIDNTFTLNYPPFNLTGTMTAEGTASGNLQFSGSSACGPTTVTWKANRSAFSPYDGSWKGSTFQGKDISFNVKKNVVNGLKVGYESCTSSSGIATVLTFYTGSPINGKNFGISGSGGDLTVTGTFTDEGTVEGNLLFKFSGCKVEGTWKATKVYPFQP